jgi:hypothetical protein
MRAFFLPSYIFENHKAQHGENGVVFYFVFGFFFFRFAVFSPDFRVKIKKTPYMFVVRCGKTYRR